jgi:hypothetical protein
MGCLRVLGSRPEPVGGGERAAEPTSDKEVELIVVEVAQQYGRQVLGAEITDVQRYNYGWDLEFRLPDGGEELVEVKGSARQGRFILTRNELSAARSHDNWILLHIVNLVRGLQPRVLRYSRLGAELTDDSLQAITWKVDSNALPHEVIDILPIIETGQTSQLFSS